LLAIWFLFANRSTRFTSGKSEAVSDAP